MNRINKPESPEGFKSLYDIVRGRNMMNLLDTAKALKHAIFMEFWFNPRYYNFNPHNIIINEDLTQFYFNDRVYFRQLVSPEGKAQYPEKHWQTVEDIRFSSDYIVACSLLHALLDRNPFYEEPGDKWLNNVRNLKFTFNYEYLDNPALGHALTRVLQGEQLLKSLWNADFYYQQELQSEYSQEQNTEETSDSTGRDESEHDSTNPSAEAVAQQEDSDEWYRERASQFAAQQERELEELLSK